MYMSLILYFLSLFSVRTDMKFAMVAIVCLFTKDFWNFVEVIILYETISIKVGTLMGT